SLLAHVRGVAYSTEVNISVQNTHPFRFEGSTLALAHNGDLYRFAEIRDLLASAVAPQWRRQICGTTDSEWIAALQTAPANPPEPEPAPRLKVLPSSMYNNNPVFINVPLRR
ncbi:MAG: hypothetical protein EBS99_15850, partial [Betaproteobacteria bacterium]|nr:hypothetical protein [Betaproteobacteria bacterium]